MVEHVDKNAKTKRPLKLTTTLTLTVTTYLTTLITNLYKTIITKQRDA